MERIKLDDFTRYKFLSDISYSPNGEHACFAVHEMFVDDNKYHSNLWLYNEKRNEYFQLTSFNEESSFTWLEDSVHILFSGLRETKDKERKNDGEEFTQFYTININGGEAKKFFRIDKKVKLIKQIDTNTYIFIATYKTSKMNFEELKKRKEEKDYIVLDEIPFWSNGKGYTNKDRNRLYIYHKDTGKIKPLTDEYTDVKDFNLNKNKTNLVFIANKYENKMELENAVFVYDIVNDNLKQFTSNEKFRYDYANFMTDKSIIVTGSDMKRYGVNENSKFYVIDLVTSKRRCITPDFEVSTWNSVGSDCRYGRYSNKDIDGRYLYFITTENDSSYINRIDDNGIIEKVTTKKGSVDGFTVKNGSVLFIGLRDMKLQDIYKVKEEELQITDFNEWLHKEKKVATLEKLTVETDKGIVIDGWVMRPVDFSPNNKYPAILDIHGGPKTVYGEVFYHEMQYWANEGYVVFFCNPRGSDGRGNEFADIRGKYGTIDYDDIMKFTDAVIEKYSFIDADRVGVTGGSYGGFMTNWIIGHTDRFKAAASQRSISNWISKFCTTDIGYYFVNDQIQGTPWNDQEKLWWHSPLKYADKVKTPTLFIHSEEDYRCWLVEGIQMFTALKYHGVESRMCIFKEENHELSRSGKPKHRIRRLKEITDWFNKYLKE